MPAVVLRGEALTRCASSPGRRPRIRLRSLSRSSLDLRTFRQRAADGPDLVRDTAGASHGDFGWPGIALANRVISRYDALPWRMSADEYERLVARSKAREIPRLSPAGPPVAARWDPDHLVRTMAALHVALHAEATLDLLVEGLA